MKHLFYKETFMKSSTIKDLQGRGPFNWFNPATSHDLDFQCHMLWFFLCSVS